MQASFEGQMQRVETPDLLTFVNLPRRTGLLELDRVSQQTRIFFQGGDPVFASSTREGLRLGDMLVRVGKITQRDLDRCVARHRVAGDRVGQILVAERLLNDTELRSYLKVQVSEVIFDTFTWGEGRFAFYDDVAHPPDVITIAMNLQNLLMEGVRRVDERGRLAEAFPDHEALVEALANPEWVKDKMSLTKEEWGVFFLVDGRRSLQEICQLAGNLDDLATLEILNHLRGANLIGLVGSPSRLVEQKQTEAVPVFRTQSYSAEEVLARLAALPPEEPVALIPRFDDSASLVSPMAIQYSVTKAPKARLSLEGSAPPVSYPLQRDTYTLGRSPKNDIVLPDPNISMFHARVDRGATGFTMVDLRSTNGTSVNKVPLKEPVPLRPNDLIQLGLVRLRFVED